MCVWEKVGEAGGGAGRDTFSLVLTSEESGVGCKTLCVACCGACEGLSAVHAVLGGGGTVLFDL